MALMRTQIQLTTEQHRRLKELARSRRVSIAELIREGIAVVLAEADRQDKISDVWVKLEAGWARQAAMPDDGGPTDIVENHDKYLADWIYERKIAPGVRRYKRSVRARVAQGAAKSRRKGGSS